MKHVLTIAGSDCSGGAGIQADLKTMCAHGVYGMSVITAITAQNTQMVTDVQDIAGEMVAKQIDAVFDDIRVDALKIGMVSSAEIIGVIRERLLHHNARHIVVDPVMVSKSGYHLLREDAVKAVEGLVSIAEVVTPNIPEAELLAGFPIQNREDMRRAAQTILKMGAKNVLIKGGHMEGNSSDLLVTSDSEVLLEERRIPTQNTHGTGCTLSAAIACGLAKGLSTEQAVRSAKEYITRAIEDALSPGKGVGPVGHLIQLYRDAGMQID